jgi:hypothetical protein
MTVELDPGADRFDPYVRVPGASHRLDLWETRSEIVRELLLTRAVEQAQSIIDAVDRAETRRLPLVLQGLDRETKGFFTRRIVAMLTAYRRFLTERAHADVQRELDIVFRPIGTWIGGQYAITSPALLVVQSILYSHCEWFHESGWEAKSAIRAYRELRGASANRRAVVPDRDARFIAAIIAHQTLLRASWTSGQDDRPEVLARIGDEWAPSDDREAVGLGIARTLFPFLLGAVPPPPDSAVEPQAGSHTSGSAEPDGSVGERQLAAALVLHSICLYCRHSRNETSALPAIKSQAINALDAILTPERKATPPVLAYIQYGRYVDAAQGNRGTLLNDARQHILDAPGGDNVMFAFQRVPSKNVWRNACFDTALVVPREREQQETGGDAIDRLVGRTIGHAFFYRSSAEHYINALLGIPAQPAAKGGAEGDLGELLARRLREAHAAHMGYVRENRYLPAPLVGHVIRTLRDCRSGEFTPVHVIARDIRQTAAAGVRDVQLTLWLPCVPDGIAPPADCWRQLDMKRLGTPDAYSLIARYAAALMVSAAVSFAPRELVLDFLSDSARDSWGPWIEAAFRSNGGVLMTSYVEQVRSRRAISPASGEAAPALAGPTSQGAEALWCLEAGQSLNVLGLDAGGTAVKATLYTIESKRAAPSAVWTSNPLAAVPMAQRYFSSGGEPDLDGFLRSIPIPGDVRIDALGISFAAPIMDGVPVGRSGVSARFVPIARNRRDRGSILEAHERDLHRIDFAAAASRVFRDCHTVVINDGDADIRSSPEVPGGGIGITVTIKEGTGVAFAVWENHSPVDILAETAKGILNINAGTDTSKRETWRFQREELSRRCSRNKFATLLDECNGGRLRRLLPKGVDERDITGLLIGALLEASVTVPTTNPKRTAAVLDFLGKSNESAPKKTRNTFGKSLGNALAAFESFDVNIPDSEAEALYSAALGEMRTRAKLALGVAVADESRLSASRAARLNRQIAFDLPYKTLSAAEKMAVRCAAVLGRWLADVIALTWEVYGPNEVRLAGGPMSGKTGVFVALSAKAALEEVYAFDIALDRLGTSQSTRTLLLREVLGSSHGPREIRKLVLAFPPEESSEGGPKGAALAAFHSYLTAQKMRQLQVCRSVVARRQTQTSLFDVDQVIERARKGETFPWLIEPYEVGEMLTLESAALRLTRQPSSKFRILDET